MDNPSTIVILILIIILIFNYISLISSSNISQIIKNMGIGYNLANTFDNYNYGSMVNNPFDQITLKGNSIPTKQMIKDLKKSGFKTIRFPVTWINFLDEQGNIDPQWMSLIKQVIDIIIKNNLYCILNVYGDGKDGNWLSKGMASIDKYINLWTQIAEEFKNYDEYLIFESMDEIIYYTSNYKLDYDTYNYFSQIFVDTIRNANKYNKQRLLIISGFDSDFYSTSDDRFKIPIDPYNKLALSIHYYYPNLFVLSKFYNEWGDEIDYQNLIENFEKLKDNFIDKGIPIIISEIGVKTEEKKLLDSIYLYLHSIFSLALEYGMVPCLWDTSNKTFGDMNFYNRETNQWYDEKIQNIFSLISRGKHIKPSDYYVMTNTIVNENNNKNCNLDISILNQKPVKMIINATIKGKILENIDNFFIYCYTVDETFSYIEIDPQNIQKQYDGTSIVNIDISDYNCYSWIYTLILDIETLLFNNITVEFKERFQFFDYNKFRNSFINSLH